MPQTNRYGETDRGTETDRDRAMRYRERQNRQIEYTCTDIDTLL